MKEERKTVFRYAHVKWFYGQSERTYYLNYFIIRDDRDFVLKLVDSYSGLWMRKTFGGQMCTSSLCWPQVPFCKLYSPSQGCELTILEK